MSRTGSEDAAPIGVLLAAGRSRRMGRTKQLMPWTDGGATRPLVAAAFDAIAPCCRAMIVVLGHEADAIAAALAPRAFTRVNADPDAPMFESIRAGLAAARALDPTADVLLHPADHPRVAPGTLTTLLRARDPARAVMPVVADASGDRGGHPVLIGHQLTSRLLALEAPGGLRQLWLAEPHLCIRIPVTDTGVLLDLDTPADLPRTV